MSDFRRYVDTDPWCSICWEVRTGRENGVCYECDQGLNVDSLLTRFALPNPLRFPMDPETELPCQAKPRLFDGTGPEGLRTRPVRQEARNLCYECPVLARDWCLDVALANPDHCRGVWAGTNREERAIINAGLEARKTPSSEAEGAQAAA